MPAAPRWRVQPSATRAVNIVEFGGLVAAGILGGLFGSIAGLASLVTYPTLLWTGLSPIVANVTNTVSLVFSGAGSVLNSRPELARRKAWLRSFIVAGLAGGAVGAALLLVTPTQAFTKLVPWLVAASSVAVLWRRELMQEAIADAPVQNRWITFVVFAISAYGGFFGAGAGVLMLAALLLATADTLPHCTAAKNLVLGIANLVAAAFFILLADVRWTAVVPLSIGLFVGASLGPAVVRRSDPQLLTRLIAIGGVLLALKLALDAY